MTPLLLVVRRSHLAKGNVESVSVTWGSNETTECDRAVALVRERLGPGWKTDGQPIPPSPYVGPTATKNLVLGTSKARIACTATGEPRNAPYRLQLELTFSGARP